METVAHSLPKAVYRAEDNALSQVTRRFPTMKMVQDYVVELFGKEWFADMFPTVFNPPFVDTRSASSHYSLSAGEVIAIANNPSHRTVSIVLHEIAHYIERMEGRKAGHGAGFRATMLTLVRYEMGFPTFIALRDEYEHQLGGNG